MTTQNVPAKLRKLALAAGMALGLSAAVAASVTVAAPPASASTRFVDHGGRVLSAARVYPIYWGRYWAPGRVASPTPDEITHALRTVLAGSYLAGLAQYRDIGSAVIGGSRVITTSDPPSRFTDKDIEAFLNALFDAGVLPAPDEQAVYVVTIPPGIYSGEGDDFVGEHSYYQRDGHRVHYAWITDSDRPGRGHPDHHPRNRRVPHRSRRHRDPRHPRNLRRGTDGARSPTSAATPASSTASWSRPTGRTSPVAASSPHRRPRHIGASSLRR